MSSIEYVQQGAHAFLYDTYFFPELGQEQFLPAFWQSLNAISGQESGRGTTWFIRDRGHQLVLRHYLRGGFIGRFNRDHYLFTGWSQCRAIAEFRILQQACAAKLPVPRPAAAMAERHGLRYRTDILIERIDNARDLISLLQSPQSEHFYHALGSTIAQFHRQGFIHADLNIKNILRDDNDRFWLIDFDRARRVTRLSKQQELAVLNRLQRSFIKETGRSAIQWNPSEWTFLMAGYTTGMAS